MRVLAIDSSGLTATVAIVEDDQTIAEYTTNYKKTHSQTLLPMIDEMVRMVDADLKDYCSGRRTGFVYRAADRLCYG